MTILGGGLSGCLIALALCRLRPEVPVRVIEQGARLGGNHVWSFFATDLAPDGAALVEPLIAARWDHGYDVRFPGLARTLATPYRSVTSASLDAAVQATLPAGAVITGRTVVAVGPHQVTLDDGRALRSDAVIDARGAGGLPHLTGGWQKFVGQLIRTAEPHGLARPLVMDATVEQSDGYRFVYCLPFGPDRVFVEDTYYADAPGLDLAVLRGRIAAYCRAAGWRQAAVLSEETGVLPVVAGGAFAAFHAAGEIGVARAGVRAGLFQPLTSYSLPDAVRFALAIAAAADLSSPALRALAQRWARDHWRRGGFYRMLAAMLFGAAAPAERYRVLQRFYRLDQHLIERFYAGRTTMMDKLRILGGKPPVPLGAALGTALGALTGHTVLPPLDAATCP